jgi:hypothetical protein
MDEGPLRMLWSLLPILCAITVLAALIILWRARRSMWLIVAMVSAVLEVALHILQMILPGFYQVFPYLFMIWQLVAVMLAVGLLGYALETAKKPDR